MSDEYRDKSNFGGDEYSDGFSAPSRRRYSGEESYYGDQYSERFTEPEDSVYSHSRAHKSRRRRKKSVFRRVLSFLIILLLIVTGVFGIFAWRIINAVNYAELDPVYQEHYQDANSELVSRKDVFNILIFGVDDVTSDYGRSDTMLLLSMDNKNSKLKLTSFQRDTFVYVPDPQGDYHTKLTNAFSYGGVGLAMRTIEANYGIKIDRYATVNFETFKSIVDVLGGVELELTDREILYINCQIAQNNQTEYLDAQEGKVKLCGQQALWHIRNRGGDVINGVEFYEGTDWDRTQRQRDFVDAIMNRIRKGSLVSSLKVADSIAPYVTTNLTKGELVSLLLKAPKLAKYRVEQCSMPSDGNWGYEENFAGSVIYVYDWQSTKDDLCSFIYGTE